MNMSSRDGSVMGKRRYRRHLMGVALVGALAGLLIWSKLRLATDVPRSAYAVPEQKAPANEAKHPEAPKPEAQEQPAAEITPALSD